MLRRPRDASQRGKTDFPIFAEGVLREVLADRLVETPVQGASNGIHAVFIRRAWPGGRPAAEIGKAGEPTLTAVGAGFVHALPIAAVVDRTGYPVIALVVRLARHLRVGPVGGLGDVRIGNCIALRFQRRAGGKDRGAEDP